MQAFLTDVTTLRNDLFRDIAGDAFPAVGETFKAKVLVAKEGSVGGYLTEVKDCEVEVTELGETYTTYAKNYYHDISFKFVKLAKVGEPVFIKSDLSGYYENVKGLDKLLEKCDNPNSFKLLVSEPMLNQVAWLDEVECLLFGESDLYTFG